MRVLVTGACGLVARALLRELGDRHELRLLDQTLPEEATTFSPGSFERRPDPLRASWPFVQAEITDVPAMRAAMEDIEAVIHLAASVSGRPEVGVETFTTNALGTFVVIDAARLVGVKRFLCASSINAYGTIYWRLSGKPPEYKTLPLTEDFPPVPEDPYSLSKLVNEETCAAFHRAYGMTTAAFRFASVWTDEMYRRRLEEGLEPTQSWNDDLFQWVHVEDVARALRQALEDPMLPGHGVYTLAAADTRCPEPTMDILWRFRPDLAASLTRPLPGRSSLVSSDRARLAFGYSPRFALGGVA